MSLLLVRLTKSQGIAKAIRLPPQGTMNVCRALYLTVIHQEVYKVVQSV